MEFIAIAIAPGLAISLYFFYRDLYNREPKTNLVISFILGGLAIIPAIIVEKAFAFTLNGTVTGAAIFAYAVVACSEELSKFIGLRFYSYNKRTFDEPLDGIVYGVVVSMGFATVENIKYVLEYAQIGRGMEVGIQRMFLSVPAHATFGVIMGYFVGKAKFDSARSAALMLIGIGGAILFHGTFDFFLFLDSFSYVGEQTADGLLIGGAIVSFVIAIALSRKLFRRQQLISKRMYKERHTPPNV